MADPIIVRADVTDTSTPHQKRPRLLDALQAAIEKAPAPPAGTDIQTYRLIALEIEFGGFVESTTTRATIEVFNHALPHFV